MEAPKMNLLLAGIVIWLLTTQAQATSTITIIYCYKQSAQKTSTVADKSREFAKLQRKQRASERKITRREAKLNRKMEAIMMRMTGGFAYFSAP